MIILHFFTVCEILYTIRAKYKAFVLFLQNKISRLEFLLIFDRFVWIMQPKLLRPLRRRAANTRRPF